MEVPFFIGLGLVIGFVFGLLMYEKLARKNEPPVG